jgi:predicted O-methyltransferase YrrM
MILNRLINKLGIGPLILKRRHRAAVRSALFDARCKSNSLFAVKRALEQVESGIATTPERDLWKRIECRRRELSKRGDTVQDIDYGAGYPGSQYNEDQQRRGVVTTISVRELASFSNTAVWAEVLYHLTRVLRPEKVLEMGTCVGISGSYIAAALQFNNRGRLWTIEGSPATAVLAQETFQMLGLGPRVISLVGPFHDTLNPCLKEQRPFDLIFVDGHHDGKATVSYFRQLKLHLSSGAIIVFDDIDWSSGMSQAWSEISADPSVRDFVRIGGMGAAAF